MNKQMVKVGSLLQFKGQVRIEVYKVGKFSTRGDNKQLGIKVYSHIRFVSMAKTLQVKEAPIFELGYSFSQGDRIAIKGSMIEEDRNIVIKGIRESTFYFIFLILAIKIIFVF